MSWGIAHRQYDVSYGPNAHLIHANSFFAQARRSRSVYLVHITHAYDEICASGALYASGGCLVGSVYCTPAIPDGGRLRLHNLGAYYYHHEAPAAWRASGGDTNNSVPRAFIIEVESEHLATRLLEGVNYLNLGAVHLDIYQRLNYLLSPAETEELEAVILAKLRVALPLLTKLQSSRLRHPRASSPAEIYRTLRASVASVPFFGYLYFEALSKCMMLHQVDAASRRAAEQGEFYNWHYKRFLYEVGSSQPSTFNLGLFNPPPDQVRDYIKKHQLMDNADVFMADLQEQIVGFAAEGLLGEDGRDETLDHLVEPMSRISRLAEVPKVLSPLAGHLVHRELRNFRRYPDFYFYFDQIKALEAWNYWNRKNIVIPFNAILPKGEVGINPAFTDKAQYRVYEAAGLVTEGDSTYLELGRERDIRLIPRLVDYHRSFMRTRPQLAPDLHDSLTE